MNKTELIHFLNLKIIPGNILDYAEENTTGLSEPLKGLYDWTRNNVDLWQMMIGPVEAKFLQMLVKLGACSRAIEVGAFTGFSTLAIAEALPVNGTITTIDSDSETWDEAAPVVGMSPHAEKIHFLHGDGMEVLENVAPGFDFAFIDADKENYINYWNAVLPLMSVGGIIVVDNVLWRGAALDPREPAARAISDFNNLAKNDSRAEVVFLTIRDGMTVARKL